MKQRNFILTDIMQTANALEYENFIKFNTLKNQSIDLTGEYYTLHNFDLKSYDRKIAMIDVQENNDRIANNKEFTNELKRRIENLQQQNFKIIVACPWESIENFMLSSYYPRGYKEEFLWHGGLSYLYFYMYNRHYKKNFEFDHSNKKYDYLYLNKRPREHRIRLYNKLKDNKSLQNSLTSFVFYSNYGKKSEKSYTYGKSDYSLEGAYELPWLDKSKGFPMYGFDEDLYEKPYNETACSIVSETNDNDSDVFLTEKIWKCMMSQHIFIVHGNYQYLKKLKDLGFKTFNSIFDESYDNIRDPNERINAIAKLIESLQGSDWLKLYEETKEIRQHNFETFWNKNVIAELINNELLRWFKFVDSSQVSSTES